MSDIPWNGLDGANPLHFMASLGALRLLSRGDDAATVRWAWREGAWRPTFALSAVPGAPSASPFQSVADFLSSWLIALSATSSPDSGSQRRVRELKAKLNGLKTDLKSIDKSSRSEAKSLGLSKAERSVHILAAREGVVRQIEETQTELATASDELTDQLGIGIAHLGDIIGVPEDLFRRRAVTSVERWLSSRGSGRPDTPSTDDPELVMESLSSQACDGLVQEGRVVPTPYSFGNGASGQCLLKDFRACAQSCTPEAVTASITGEGLLRDDLSGLNWDPADQRSYALQWRNPEKGKRIEAVPNALAFVGLMLLPLAPGSRDRAVAWRVDRDGQAFSWPLWDPPLRLRAVRGLLAGAGWRRDGGDPALLRKCGILEVRESARINPTGKRPFFAPSRSV